MSSIVVAGNTSGSITISAPDVSGSNTLTLPAATGTVIYSNASGNLQANSGYGSVATGYLCRAWVNFNGTGTVAIRASGNVTSITDNGTGDYTVNFTTAMPDANYSSVANSGLNSAATAYVICYTNARSTSPFTQAPTTTAMRFVIAKGVLSTDVTSDSEYLNVAIFR
jgi:hypothetical protein